MGYMDRIYLSKEHVVEYITESMNSFKHECVIVNDARYHHNSDYTSAVSILKNNILSLDEMNRKRVCLVRGRLFFDPMNPKLALRNGVNGAGTSAGTAVDASIGVDHHLGIAHSDRTDGAAALAGAAADASVRNDVSHTYTSK